MQVHLTTALDVLTSSGALAKLPERKSISAASLAESVGVSETVIRMCASFPLSGSMLFAQNGACASVVPKALQKKSN